MALVDHRPRTATVRSTTPVLMDVIARREFQALLADMPDIADRIRTTIAERRDATMNQNAVASEFITNTAATP